MIQRKRLLPRQILFRGSIMLLRMAMFRCGPMNVPMRRKRGLHCQDGKGGPKSKPCILSLWSDCDGLSKADRIRQLFNRRSCMLPCSVPHAAVAGITPNKVCFIVQVHIGYPLVSVNLTIS
jgi:hypothetical protein